MPIDSASSSVPRSPADALAAPAGDGSGGGSGAKPLTVITAIGTLVMQVLLAVLFFVLFFVLFSPLAMLLRALGVDVLGLRRDERATSYWRKTGSKS
jgi:hypothetical protein